MRDACQAIAFGDVTTSKDGTPDKTIRFSRPLRGQAAVRLLLTAYLAGKRWASESNPTDEQIKQALYGVMCRCSGTAMIAAISGMRKESRLNKLSRASF